MAKKKQYTRFTAVMVTEDTYRELKKICDQLEISVSEYAREAIETKLKSNENQQIK